MNDDKKINLGAAAHEEDDEGNPIEGYEEVDRDQIFWFARYEAGLVERSAEYFADWADENWNEIGAGDPEMTARDVLSSLLQEWRGGQLKDTEDWQKV